MRRVATECAAAVAIAFAAIWVAAHRSSHVSPHVPPPASVPRQRAPSPPPVVVDSHMSLRQALRGARAPAEITRRLAIVDVRYLGFDRREHQGQLVVRRDLARGVRAIFADIDRLRFPLSKAVPVAAYGWSDDASMAANNTSAFNYRRVPAESHLSRHSFGAAIDVNPRINPYIDRRGAHPRGARYVPGRPGTIVPGPVVRAFTRRGWRWGGHYARHKDWQHFWKP